MAPTTITGWMSVQVPSFPLNMREVKHDHFRIAVLLELKAQHSAKAASTKFEFEVGYKSFLAWGKGSLVMWEEDERGAVVRGGDGWHWLRVMVALDSGGLGRGEGKRKERGRGLLGGSRSATGTVSATGASEESSQFLTLLSARACICKYSEVYRVPDFQLTVSVAAVVINVVAIKSSGDVPLNTTHLLWVNLIMDTLGALALATEPPTYHLMHRTPAGRISNVMRKILSPASVEHNAWELKQYIEELY
ncbi:hypothetical protein RJ639_034143 [Escallonia herrerae]|uniref:Cation-transporting P-type ATPase C-terminal domain-containing protein n=1 Tax=Escallonia herrerae TaxID=1293975 RepID=A0AA88WW39_9ASTE|nr:hypothetical protein RJ639_034143 [Escallonia herrerae]